MTPQREVNSIYTDQRGIQGKEGDMEVGPVGLNTPNPTSSTKSQLNSTKSGLFIFHLRYVLGGVVGGGARVHFYFYGRREFSE